LSFARVVVGQGFDAQGPEVRRVLGLGVVPGVPGPGEASASRVTGGEQAPVQGGRFEPKSKPAEPKPQVGRRERRATKAHASRVRKTVVRELDERAKHEPHEMREYSDLIEAGHFLSERDFRRVRAAIADRSSARNLLWLIGADQAAKFAELDFHQPQVKRAVAIHYALHQMKAPEGFASTIRTGVGRAYFAALSADPRNPNLRGANDYRPSVTTISHTLGLIEEVLGYDFTRWQAPHDETASCEWLPGARHPVNRYYVAHTSSHRGLTALLEAFGKPAVSLKELRTRREAAESRSAEEAREACAEWAEQLKNAAPAESASVAPPS
jgi:hypothetical protein